MINFVQRVPKDFIQCCVATKSFKDDTIVGIGTLDEAVEQAKYRGVEEPVISFLFVPRSIYISLHRKLSI